MLPNPLTGKKSKYKWSERLGRYVYKSSNKVVSFKQVRSAFEGVIAASEKKMRAVTQQLIDGRISLADWQLSMAGHIKSLHTASAAAARGGWSRMSQSDYRAAEQLMKEQMKFLKKFAKEVRTKKQPLNGRALQRASMYAHAGRATFEETRRRHELLANGKTMERRLLGAADHCPDCIAARDMGWQPIGTLPRIGQSVCRTNCHCRFEYK